VKEWEWAPEPGEGASQWVRLALLEMKSAAPWCANICYLEIMAVSCTHPWADVGPNYLQLYIGWT
jgi:hypothetical protein